MNEGLKASPNGRIGPEIYFAEKENAMKIADHRNEGNGVVVLRVRSIHQNVYLGCIHHGQEFLMTSKSGALLKGNITKLSSLSEKWCAKWRY